MTMRIAVTFIACSAIWGSTFLAIRLGNEATPPVWAATIRLALASVLLFGIAAAFRIPLPRGKALRGAALWGFFNLGVNLTLLYVGDRPERDLGGPVRHGPALDRSARGALRR